jgi:hypothetical protein
VKHGTTRLLSTDPSSRLVQGHQRLVNQRSFHNAQFPLITTALFSDDTLAGVVKACLLVPVSWRTTCRRSCFGPCYHGFLAQAPYSQNFKKINYCKDVIVSDLLKIVNYHLDSLHRLAVQCLTKKTIIYEGSLKDNNYFSTSSRNLSWLRIC